MKLAINDLWCGVRAGVAQQAEQLICNHQVPGSIPGAGSKKGISKMPESEKEVVGFKVGDEVCWESQAGGHRTVKSGVVKRIMKKEDHPVPSNIANKEFPKHQQMFDGWDLPGNSNEAYLIEVLIGKGKAMPRLYMPNPKYLKLSKNGSIRQAAGGFTLFEFMVVLAIVGIVCMLAIAPFFNNRGATQERAKENARMFLKDNNIEVKRLSCAGDSDSDGYGTCTVTTAAGERIMLKCPCGFIDVEFFGATGCKEEFVDVNVGGGPGKLGIIKQ